MAEYIGIEGPYRTRQGYWVCRWNEPGTGRRRSHSLGSTTNQSKGDAQQAMLRFSTQVATNPEMLTAPGHAPTIVEWCERFLAMRPKLGRKTKSGYQNARDHMTRVFGPDRRVHQVTREDAKRLRADLETKLAAFTTKSVLARCSAMLAEAEDAGHLARNPFRGVSVKASVDKTWSRPTIAEFRRIVNGWDNPRSRCMIALARLAGLRLNEVCKARWSDIDWARGLISVHTPEVAGRGGQERTTKRRHRVVPLEPELREILWAAFEEAGKPLHGLIGGSWENARRSLSRRLLVVGIPEWTDPYHGCRKMRITEWCDRPDLTPTVIAEWAGNSVAVIMKHYTRATDDALARVTGRSQTMMIAGG